jgi:hypothetical protein
MAVFEHVRQLEQIHEHLTAADLKPGFVVESERIPLLNPQRGIFKPHQMRHLLSIMTVFPRPGGKIWYDDQREVHRQISRPTRRSTTLSWARTLKRLTTDGFARRPIAESQSYTSSASRLADIRLFSPRSSAAETPRG